MASLAKAYKSMKKSGHMMAKGGECPMCSGGRCMYAEGTKDAEPAPTPTPSPFSPEFSNAFGKGSGFSNKKAHGGEIKGVHKEDLYKGISHAGSHLRDIRYGGEEMKKAGKEVAKGEHQRTLAELKEMPNPKLKGLAHGGSVHESDMEIDRPKDKMEKKWAGESTAGALLRNSDINHGSKEKSKDEHHKILGRIKSMAKPKLEGFADGGAVSMDQSFADAFKKGSGFAKGGKVFGTDMDAAQSKSFMEKGEHTGEYAEGGEADEELIDHCCDELVDAIESKDKKQIKESLRAIIMSLKG